MNEKTRTKMSIIRSNDTLNRDALLFDRFDPLSLAGSFLEAKGLIVRKEKQTE
jgi:hypothetical protein